MIDNSIEGSEKIQQVGMEGPQGSGCKRYIRFKLGLEIEKKDFGLSKKEEGQ